MQYASVERQVKVSAKEKIRLNLECDELWSFVDHKGNKQVWLAMDRKQEKLLSLYWGTKPRRGKNLWNFYLLYIDNVLSVIQIFGSRVLVFFRRVIKE